MPAEMSTAPAPQAVSGAATVRKVLCRVSGVLACVLGFVVGALGLLTVIARNTGNTLGGIIENPTANPALYGPFLIFTGLVLLVLGVLIYRQNVMAAVALLVFSLASEVATYLIPVLNEGGKYDFTRADALGDGVIALVTIAIVIADRMARRPAAST
jgi:hypothetical protein